MKVEINVFENDIYVDVSRNGVMQRYAEVIAPAGEDGDIRSNLAFALDALSAALLRHYGHNLIGYPCSSEKGRYLIQEIR